MFRCLPVVLLGATLLSAQVPAEVVVLGLCSELHVGLAVHGEAGRGQEFGFGVPVALGETWGLRFRYADLRTKERRDLAPNTLEQTTVSRRQLMCEGFWQWGRPMPSGLSRGPYLLAGLGVQLAKHRREVFGQIPEGEQTREAWTTAPILVAAAGLRVSDWVALELRGTLSRHRFEGRTFPDRSLTASLHIWPLRRIV